MNRQPAPSSVASSVNHRLSAEVGWFCSHSQASSTSVVLSRGLPALDTRARSPRSQDGCRKPCRGTGTLQAMRASLLASAMASLCRCSRSDAVLSHAPTLRDQVWGRIRRTLAAWTSTMRKYRLPRLETRPRIATALTPGTGPPPPSFSWPTPAA